PKAPVTLVEYASVTCAHCADFNARLMPRIEADYIRTGKVR
ncbi:MAG: thioredoxin domain-containing protein, partial [Asticcacaulis sp.]|nr:thioredoxin domain-containing protein [Asticcacaulis sp.]